MPRLSALAHVLGCIPKTALGCFCSFSLQIRVEERGHKHIESLCLDPSACLSLVLCYLGVLGLLSEPVICHAHLDMYIYIYYIIYIYIYIYSFMCLFIYLYTHIYSLVPRITQHSATMQQRRCDGLAKSVSWAARSVQNQDQRRKRERPVCKMQHGIVGVQCGAVEDNACNPGTRLVGFMHTLKLLVPSTGKVRTNESGILQGSGPNCQQKIRNVRLVNISWPLRPSLWVAGAGRSPPKPQTKQPTQPWLYTSHAKALASHRSTTSWACAWQKLEKE